MTRFPKEASLKRRYNRQPPKCRIYVLCEGKVTEPEYIKQFARQHSNDRVYVEPIPGVGVPLTVAEKAVELKKQLLKAAQKSKDSFEKAFSVWCVVDVDNHPNMKAAKALASFNKIKFCVSNPCFELWGLLHLKPQDAYIHRHILQSDLHKEMPSYHHDKNPILDYEQIKNEYTIAKTRAITICKRRIDEDKEGCNPSTNVYELFDNILANGKK